MDIYLLTPDRWPDLETLFGPQGAQWGCWCMWWRLSNPEFEARSRDERREMLKGLAQNGPPPGLIAYEDGQAIGWCSVAPREDFLPRLERSRYWKPIDGSGIWSLVCFFVKPTHRGQALAKRLLDAAVDYAAAQGASAVEAYPKDIGDDLAAPGSIYFGTARMFADAGFEEIERRHPERPIVRRTLSGVPPY